MTRPKRPKNPYGPFYGPVKRSEEWDNFSLPHIHRVEVAEPKRPKLPCELRRERGGADIYWPPGFLDGMDWSTPPPQCELVRVEPMKMPSSAIFYLNSLEKEVTEDMICRSCKKIIIPKGDMSSSVPHTTDYLTEISESTEKPVWNGTLEYACHDCEPPKKRKPRVSVDFTRKSFPKKR